MSNIPEPRGFEYKPIYEPDQKRMVKALKVLVEYIPKSKENVQEIQDQTADSKKTG